ncbi:MULTISPECIES: SIS domain-containing protein [Vibrio]|uniref:KpsF/GutQ family sugar-phosphate isomerase n=1 Tax=Vibrio TaxID=662 RepID=UPI00028E2ABA|nr:MULTISPECIES: KpsF/GutQ family sugar-phosphate isomerase [Vibrio]EKM12162.1 sugar isomerase, KpsF/GutQ family protein [Vibrio harveyi]MCR9308428.1 KpsF/GutQ family sugar-phosphate isomerase [Vibrio diabolicus]MDU9594136.1 KpsF/GutQ family sugar-phosphate isomerase [Vibrio sp. 2-1-2a]MDU9603076.1 KpsF/GutQ family sugar-phosphate isomerase [Vibrio sp. 1-2-3a]
MSYLDVAKAVIKNEIEGIIEVEHKLGPSFEELVRTISSSQGRVVMCGMGKSGHIAKKIFATLVSTGTPSMYMHPAEAFHGDLGMIQSEDIFFAISNSGETSEVTQLLPFIKANGNLLVAMTGNKNSTLGQYSDFHLDIGVNKEACPLNLAPTSSTTASLVLGDALAIALMQANGFKEENFARYHPGGSLGRRLLMTVSDCLQRAVFVPQDAQLIDILGSISNCTTGSVLVGDPDSLLGIITDGDIRKYLNKCNSLENLKVIATDIMTKEPKLVSSITKCIDADAKMASEAVNSLVVVESNRVIGIYDKLNRK